MECISCAVFAKCTSMLFRLREREMVIDGKREPKGYTGIIL